MFPWLKDIDKNLIRIPIIISKSPDHEKEILRDELKITHYTYKKEIYRLKYLMGQKESKLKAREAKIKKNT